MKSYIVGIRYKCLDFNEYPKHIPSWKNKKSINTFWQKKQPKNNQKIKQLAWSYTTFEHSPHSTTVHIQIMIPTFPSVTFFHRIVYCVELDAEAVVQVNTRVALSAAYVLSFPVMLTKSGPTTIKKNELYQKKYQYLWTCVPSEDSDQTAQSRSLI